MCKSKIYHVSSPFETPDSGDYDYGTAIIHKLREVLYTAQYLTLDSIGIIQECGKEMCLFLGRFNSSNSEEFWEKFNYWIHSDLRKNIVKQMLEFIASDVQQNNIDLPILNLQLRPLETGLFFVPEDFEQFKEKNIQINVTCHEYKLNETRPLLQSVLHGYFSAADTVSFFNLSDLTKASKHATHMAFDFHSLTNERQQEWNNLGYNKFEEWISNFHHDSYNLVAKMILTRVLPTIGADGSDTINYDQFLQRKPNILVFGTIRPCKGVEEAIDIAKVLKQNQHFSENLQDTRVIIIGNPIKGYTAGIKIVLNLINDRFDVEVIKSVLKATSNGNITQKQLKQAITNKLTQIINDNNLKQYIALFDQKEKELDIQELLPIDIKIGYNPAEVRDLCRNTRYAIKYDNKGWANNASSHISCLVNGCIVYTGWGMNTPLEVLEGGDYHEAVVFLANKYGLKDGTKLTLKQRMNREQQKHYQMSNVDITKVPHNKDPVNAVKILADIINRENLSNKARIMSPESVVDDFSMYEGTESDDKNSKSFESAQKLALEFTDFVGISLGRCLTDANERKKQYEKFYDNDQGENGNAFSHLHADELYVALKNATEVHLMAAENHSHADENSG